MLHKILPITEVARSCGIPRQYLIPYGNHIAKVSFSLLDRKRKRAPGNYVLVTAMTPTPLGEGKTVTTIGLAMALSRLGKKTFACLRQPSLGPLFGIKGGGTGGGRAMLEPAVDINLSCTGDNAAIAAAHNLLASVIDNHLIRKSALDLDPRRVVWRRVVDINDRALRTVMIGAHERAPGFPRMSGFDITAASELMAIVALAKDRMDLKRRIGRIVVGYRRNGRPVSVEDLSLTGALAVILKDVIHPNLVQTSEGTPCFVHTGPFGNIAHGNSSLIADRIALCLSEYVVTESGFGADCGAEKFFDIKCRQSRLSPRAVVLVCSLRSIKMHSGRYGHTEDRAMLSRLSRPDTEAVREGFCNVSRQIENVRAFGMPVVVCINRFSFDTQGEIALARELSCRAGASEVAVSTAYQHGGAGALALARAVARVCARRTRPRLKLLYALSDPLAVKIERVATRMYGAGRVRFSARARRILRAYTRAGYGNLPVCMAKTQLSLSHDPSRLGSPRGFVFPVEDIRVSKGAGFLYVLCGKISTMPGLPAHPAAEGMDIDRNGTISGVLTHR